VLHDPVVQHQERLRAADTITQVIAEMSLLFFKKKVAFFLSE
jgi:hypothetical protein